MNRTAYIDEIRKKPFTEKIVFKPIKAFCLKPSVLPLRATALECCESFVKIPDTAQSPFGIIRNVTAIDKELFYQNTYVTDIVLPRFLETIPSEAFCGCENLQRIYIPRGIRRIEPNTFKDCKKLTDIFFEGSPQEWERIKPETHYIKTELSAENIPGTPVRKKKSEQMIFISGNEALIFAVIHFCCKI